MSDYLGQLIHQYSRQGVIVDTNVLLLFFVGKYEPLLIAKHKRTRQYSIEDFQILEKFLKLFQNRIITTPNILTEASNLLGDCNSSDQVQLWKNIRGWNMYFGGKILAQPKYIANTEIFEIRIDRFSHYRACEREISCPYR